jgi:hypothetical protein
MRVFSVPRKRQFPFDPDASGQNIALHFTEFIHNGKLANMELEEMLASYKAIGRQIDELEERKKALCTAIMQQMNEQTVKVGSYTVRRYSRMLIKTPIEEARMLGAIKMEETVDKDKIKELLQQGHAIQGITETQYIMVHAAKESS